jgi:SAM-dependent methyltransferase
MKPARSFLLGCGTNHSRQIQFDGKTEWTGELTTIDMDPNCGASLVLDLSIFCCNLPFDDETFDEGGAMNSMEHWGRQGDWKGWFDEMGEIHRILKPGGLMSVLVPVGEDALADPGHCRFFQKNWFYFLNQSFYGLNATKNTCFTDYRWYWKKNFDIEYCEEHDGHHLAVVLRKA